jgi:hypothetical protein
VIPAEMIKLTVAPKVNDHHGQEVHNKTMQKKRNAMKPQKTQKVQIMKTADFKKALKEIKKTAALLVKESNLIEEGLKQAELSTKRCAKILLIQKRLYRNLLELKVERLPQHWNEFWIKNSKPLLPHRKENTQDHFEKTMDKQITRIDSIRQHVGDMDIKIFMHWTLKTNRKHMKPIKTHPNMISRKMMKSTLNLVPIQTTILMMMTTGHKWISENPIKIIIVDLLAILVVNVLILIKSKQDI